MIPHHPGHGGNFCDWKDHDPRFERLVEIFQIRGSYECSDEDGNPAPEDTSKCPPFTDGYVRRALAMGPQGPVIAQVLTRGARHVLVGFELGRS